MSSCSWEPAAGRPALLAAPGAVGAVYPDENGKMVEQGVNTNELTDAADRDPISGCHHTKYTLRCVEAA